jgi:predicted amidophosphoribosyltransferase
MFPQIVLCIFPGVQRYVLIELFVFFAVGMIVKLSRPKLICPGCDRDVQRGLGDFCPQCGASGFEAANASRPGFYPVCSACQKGILFGKSGRSYPIRSCTHCGEHIDAEGL